jgi:LmbE family N-acetylglucosaminyl deacetylase
MTLFKSSQAFHGDIIIIAPHMDDEILACGGTIAQLPDKHIIYCIYATDGSQSPVPIYAWQGKVTADLPSIRKREAQSAMRVLGIPEENLFFLGLPDRKLRYYQSELSQKLKECLEQINPSLVFIPFRYDRHPDHIAINHVMRDLEHSADYHFDLVEYFVYYQWRLLPGGDVRKYVHRDQLIEIDISAESLLKKKALESYVSQTTVFFPWQHRPILTKKRVEEVSQSAELFLRRDPNLPSSSVFESLGTWIRIVHLVEPLLKNWKEQIVGIFRI